MRRVAPLLVLLVLLTGCGYSVPSDMVAVHVQEGPTQPKKVVGCEQSATRGWWTNDSYELFPTSEREWDATGQDGSDSGRFIVTTDDSVEMYVPVTVRFNLITECNTLKDFYTKYARRYGVEFEDDGTYNKAWITLLRKLVADPAQETLDRVIQDYKWRDVWNDPKIKVEITKMVNDQIGDLMQQQAQGSYFEDISVLIGKARPVNPDLAQAVALEQTNVAKAQSAEAQAKADLVKAQAEIAVKKAEALKKRADLSAYGSEETYLKELCIQTQGCQPFPSPIIPGVGQVEGK